MLTVFSIQDNSSTCADQTSRELLKESSFGVDNWGSLSLHYAVTLSLQLLSLWRYMTLLNEICLLGYQNCTWTVKHHYMHTSEYETFGLNRFYCYAMYKQMVWLTQCPQSTLKPKYQRVPTYTVTKWIRLIISNQLKVALKVSTISDQLISKLPERLLIWQRNLAI